MELLQYADMFAIIKISGKQYEVKPQDVISVDRLEGKSGDTLTLGEVLLLANDKDVFVGTPTVSGYSIKAKLLDQVQDEKVHVRRYRSKSRHRRHIGFRAQMSKLEIIDIVKS